MKNKEFAEKNLGRIFEHDGLFVEVVGYLDDYPGVISIVRYLNPDKARAHAPGGGWSRLDERDVLAQEYCKKGSVYSYVLPRYLKQVSEADAAQAFAEAYKGEKFNLRGDAVTVVGYSTGYDAVIVARTHEGWQMAEGAGLILSKGEQKTFTYTDYRNLKPIGK
nr:MAG TPA: hypothetical protein [Caudoviricetes sp.]